MVWKKIAESKELIILEKEQKDYKFKIEARKTEDLSWEVFKTKVKGEASHLLSEYTLGDMSEVKNLIEKLKKEDSPNAGIAKKNVSLSLKREYKEEFVEKWFFNIGKDKFKNFIVVKFDETISADIVLHEKYKPIEKSVLSQLEEKLGLNEIAEDSNFSLYYFRKQNSVKKKNPSEYNLVDVEFGFMGDEEP